MRTSGPIYAIGDVHGCLDLLLELESRIILDAGDLQGADRPTVIMLGDYVDRGPRSAAVVEHLIGHGPHFDRLCIAGNHEIAMLNFLDDPKRNGGWLDFGGEQTLASYGIVADDLAKLSHRAVRQVLDSHIPVEHRNFLAALPVMINTQGHVFVHAGMRPGVPFEDQTDRDLYLFRDEFEADYREFGRVVVHGHTPVPDAVLMPHRIGVDTGAYFSGKLSAVALSSDPPRILVAGGASSTPKLHIH